MHAAKIGNKSETAKLLREKISEDLEEASEIITVVTVSGSAYRLLTVSISRPVYLAINSAGMPSAFIRRAFSRLFSSMP